MRFDRPHGITNLSDPEAHSGWSITPGRHDALYDPLSGLGRRDTQTGFFFLDPDLRWHGDNRSSGGPTLHAVPTDPEIWTEMTTTPASRGLVPNLPIEVRLDPQTFRLRSTCALGCVRVPFGQ